MTRYVIELSRNVTLHGGEMSLDASLIGKKLRKLRGDTPLNIVSQRTGLGATAISNYENGIRIPRDEAKVALAKYYRKTIDELFFEASYHET